MIIRTDGTKTLEEQFDHRQIPMPGLAYPATEGNPIFQHEATSRPGLIYVSEHIAAAWYTKRDGSQAIKIYRPYDDNPVLLKTNDRAFAIKVCISVDDHKGNFGAAKRDHYQKREEVEAKQLRDRSKVLNAPGWSKAAQDAVTARSKAKSKKGKKK